MPELKASAAAGRRDSVRVLRNIRASLIATTVVCGLLVPLAILALRVPDQPNELLSLVAAICMPTAFLGGLAAIVVDARCPD